MPYPQDMLRHACSIHTEFMIARYLMSNADGRQSGAEKAQRHIELCNFYVGLFHGCDPEDSMCDFHDDWEAVHSTTQEELTDYLDEKIGFPLEGRPDYDTLIPKFFEIFHVVALETLTKRNPE